MLKHAKSLGIRSEALREAFMGYAKSKRRICLGIKTSTRNHYNFSRTEKNMKDGTF
jgi:hypothetical protein